MTDRLATVLLVSVLSFAVSGAHAFSVGGTSFRLLSGSQVKLDPSVLLGQVESGGEAAGQVEAPSESEVPTLFGVSVDGPVIIPEGPDLVSNADTNVLLNTPPDLIDEVVDVDPKDPVLDDVPPITHTPNPDDGENQNETPEVPLPGSLFLFALGLGLMLRRIRR